MESQTAHAQNLSNMIRFGTVAEVDHDAAKCRVQTGELLTDYVQWLVPTAGKTIQWDPPAVGEQVILLSAEGDLASGVAVRGLYSAAFPAPSTTPSSTLLQFADGAQVQYDSEAHALTATLPKDGTANITAPGGLTLNADVTVNGKLIVNGDASATGTVTGDQDVVGSGISLKSHAHKGVTGGNGVSGPPA